MARETMATLQAKLADAERRAHDAERVAMQSRMAMTTIRHQLSMVLDLVDKLIQGGDGG